MYLIDLFALYILIPKVPAMTTVKAWTRQVPQVWEELQQTGRYLVKEEYVRAKNAEISDYYNRDYISNATHVDEKCPYSRNRSIWLLT